MAKADTFAIILLIVTVSVIQEGSSISSPSTSEGRHDKEKSNKLCGLTLTEFEQEFEGVLRMAEETEQKYGRPLTYGELEEFVRTHPKSDEFANCLPRLYTHVRDGATLARQSVGESDKRKRSVKVPWSNRRQLFPELYDRQMFIKPLVNP